MKGDGDAAEAGGARDGDPNFVNGEENMLPEVDTEGIWPTKDPWAPGVAGVAGGVAGDGKADPRGCCPKKPP